MPLPGSKRCRRSSPESTTTRTPAMVRLVSARFVATTTLRRPAGAGRSAASCAAASRSPYSGKTSSEGSPAPAAMASQQRRISAAPGRKTSTSPGSDSSARRTTRAARCSMGSGQRLTPAGAGAAYCVATSKARPSDRTEPASPSTVATAAPSSVADMTSKRRSSRRWRCASSASARPRSDCRLRSWNSSKITQPTSSSAGSLCSRRARMPSVTTSMRVAALTRVSSRVR